MPKNFFQFVVLSLFLFFILILNGCSCNCGKENTEKFVKGFITVVGNEPFTKLAVKTDDDKIYVLQCSKELQDELWKKQGNLYYILYENSKTEMGDTLLNVEKAIPVTKESK